MCTPVLRACRRQLPRASITAIVRPGLDQLLAGCPFINSSIVCDMKGLFGPQRLARAIKQSAAQAVLLLPNSFRSAMGARIAGTPIRIGYDRDGRHALLTHAIAPGSPDHPVPMVEYYTRLTAFALGVDVIDQHLELATTSEEQQAANELLKDVAPPMVVMNPGANRSDKRWPAERFAAVADALQSRLKPAPSVLITGSPAEMDVLEAVESAARSPIVNLGRRGVTLASLKAVLRRANLLITNDTGPRHIAAALGTPVIALFGPTDHRWTTLHFPDDQMREWPLLAEPFLPEELVADKHGKACAIDKVAVNDVVHAASSMLGRQVDPITQKEARA